MNASSRIFILFLLLTISFAAHAQKTDIIHLKNGDRVTGEVINLYNNRLQFNTDHMGQIYIEWEDIREIISTTGQAVELTNGQRLHGPLTKPKDIDIIVVKTDNGPVGIKIDNVYRMYPVESGFWDRLDLSASMGFSWDKGSNVGKYYIGLDAAYRRTESASRMSFNTEITTIDKTQDPTRSSTTRTILGGDHVVFKENKRFNIYFGNFEQNDQIGIKLRTLAGTGYGFSPIRSHNNWLLLSAGIDINRESPNEGETETNLEAVGMLTYEYFKYDSPERSLKLNMTLFPSLTDLGRWRATMNSDFSLELASDFFWRLDVYATYDSKPISLDGASTDYGVTSSLAYQF